MTETIEIDLDEVTLGKLEKRVVPVGVETEDWVAHHLSGLVAQQDAELQEQQGEQFDTSNIPTDADGDGEVTQEQVEQAREN